MLNHFFAVTKTSSVLRVCSEGQECSIFHRSRVEFLERDDHINSSLGNPPN